MNANIIEATQSYANSGLHNLALVSSMVHNHPRRVKRSRRSRKTKRYTRRCRQQSCRKARKAKKYTRRR